MVFFSWQHLPKKRQIKLYCSLKPMYSLGVWVSGEDEQFSNGFCL